MKTVTIGDKQFEAVPFDDAKRAFYVDYISRTAKSIDKPILRFTQKLDGLTPEDRKSAIAGFLAKPDWDKPDDRSLRLARTEPDAVVCLCMLTLNPKLTEVEWQELIGETYESVYVDVCKALQPPSNEEIIAANKILRERMKCSTTLKT